MIGPQGFLGDLYLPLSGADIQARLNGLATIALTTVLTNTGKCSFGTASAPATGSSHRFESTTGQTGATQSVVSMTATSQGACTTLRGLNFLSTTDNSTQTITSLVGGFFGNNTKGAADTVTRSAGLHIRQQTVAATGNFGIVYSSATGLPTASGTFAFYNDTTDPSYLGGALTINSGALTLSAATGTTLVVSSTTDSTTIASGSITTLGGIGVAKRLTLDGGTGKTLKYVNGTANAAVAVTFGAVGPTGSTAGNQVGWLRVDVNGTDRYVPYW